jgi:hypothetical protein
MKKVIGLLVVTLVAATGMATVDYGNSVHWTGKGDWTNEKKWDETRRNGASWCIPGWVVGNPLNTDACTNMDWNTGYAHIDSGTVNVTPVAKPDGSVALLYVGSDAGDTILNISADFTVRGNAWMGYGSRATDVATINQTAGNVVLGVAGKSRTALGRGFGQSVYNLSGGTLETRGDWDQFGNHMTGFAEGASTFTFNQSGGTYTDTGANELVMADKVLATTVVNVSGGQFRANATWGARLGNNGTAILNMDGAGAFETSGADFNIARYATSQATVNMKGGTFAAKGTYLYIGNEGVGQFLQSGGSVNGTRLILANAEGSSGLYSISGGSLAISKYIAGRKGTAIFEVVGSKATSIEIGSVLFFGDTFRVKLDQNGSTLVKAVGGGSDTAGIDLRGCVLEVDDLTDFDGTPGKVYDIMWTANGIQVDGMEFSNLTDATLDWSVVDKDAGKVLRLTVGPTSKH